MYTTFFVYTYFIERPFTTEHVIKITIYVQLKDCYMRNNIAGKIAVFVLFYYYHANCQHYSRI